MLFSLLNSAEIVYAMTLANAQQTSLLEFPEAEPGDGYEWFSAVAGWTVADVVPCSDGRALILWQRARQRAQP